MSASGAVVIRSQGPQGPASPTAQGETSSHAHKLSYREKENPGDGVVVDAGAQRKRAQREGGVDGPEPDTKQMQGHTKGDTINLQYSDTVSRIVRI